MADLNALIAQGAQFKEPPNPFAQYAQMQQLQQGAQQNQMNQMKMQEAQRGQQEMNALRGVMSRPGFDLSTPESQRDVYRVAPTIAENFIKGHMGNVKTMGEASNLKLTGQKLAIEAAAEKEKHLAQMYRDISGRPSDANITAHAEDVAASPLYTLEEKARVAAKAQSLLELPMADRTAMLSGQGISAGELSTAATAKAGQGVTMRGQDIVAGTAAAGQQSVADTAAAGQRITARGQDIGAATARTGQNVTMRGQDIGAATARASQAQALELANRPVFNEAGQGFVSRPTAAQPAGAFTPLPGVKASQDQRAALKALKTAGYDPATGEDNISKLIGESTSGGLQAASAGALGFLFGSSTSGMKAISALAGTANQIALDIVGGKLGAGISNDDRNFIASALGDVANPYKTAEERLAGWTAAKDRMVQSGMIPPPNQSKPGAPTRENAAKGGWGQIQVVNP